MKDSADTQQRRAISMSPVRLLFCCKPLSKDTMHFPEVQLRRIGFRVSLAVEAEMLALYERGRYKR